MLQKIQFAPGFNKQQTESGAEGQWIDGDNIRFRYGQPEKIGGWQELISTTIAGPVREQLTWTDLQGRKYAALGTSKVLLIYYEGTLYDITPLDTDRAITGATFDTTDTSTTVTVNKSSHGFEVGEYIKFSTVTAPPGSGYISTNFTDNLFEIISKPNDDSFTITMATAATGTTSAAGSATITPYITIGPTFQTSAYGWGTGVWGSTPTGTGWGEETTSTTVTLAPGSWSLDNFGQILVATVKNGKTYTWDPSTLPDRFAVRAAVMTGAPTASILTLVSDRDRHLFHIGTETTIGDPSTQDPMFIRFSNQEDYNTYQPTATNTAGTFRLDTGNEIIGAVQGKDYILILTDQAAYTIQFVGPPFTFSVRQVGTNCGALGQHCMVYAQGAVFWMGFGGGFFMFDGTVKQLGSLVEDFVFTTQGDGLGINYDASQITYAAHNSLYNEVVWYYATANSTQINRNVVYNFVDKTWTTGSLSRTTYQDAHTYGLPYATEYNLTGVPTFPVINGATSNYGSSQYWSHETGVNEVSYNGTTTAITSYIQSGDYDITTVQGGVADIRGDGENIMRVSRFIPDFKNLSGNAKITLFFSNYPADTAQSSSLGPLITGPFTITTSTDKVNTRVRGRLVSLKIENDAIGETWRYGTLRLDISAGGRR